MALKDILRRSLECPEFLFALLIVYGFWGDGYTKQTKRDGRSVMSVKLTFCLGETCRSAVARYRRPLQQGKRLFSKKSLAGLEIF